MGDLSNTFHFKHFIEEESRFYPEYFRCCIICEKDIPSGSVHFRCRNCKFYFHKGCPTISLESSHTIYHPKTHEHTLTSIRKMNTFSCAACGEVYKDKMNMYGCLQCNFFVHRNCIYLPKVIKLTSHRHRLFQTFQVLDFKNCRICDKPVVYECGGYICIDESCDYKLHSYCATRKEIWDGKDVEREPEDINNSEDVIASSSLVEVDDKTSRHFSHHHDLMRLCVNNELEDGRACQACILPIDFGSFLGCKECDFALHDTCASLPRKMEHSLHRHPLTLEVNTMNIKEGFFSCSKCGRESCGFMYRCYQKECEFKMDAKCASLSDPLYIGGHEHPLNLLDSGARCNRCGIILNLKRPSLPVLVKYEYDTHPLTLCFPKSFLWMWLPPLYCEICEVKIHGYPNYESLYACTDCNTFICVECAIGKYPYLKPGITIRVSGFEIEITSNSHSRPICHACHYTCQDKLVFKNNRESVFFCSIKCIT